MKKLLLLLLLIPALANATVTPSFTANASGTTLSGVAPLAVYWDGTATTSTSAFTATTGTGTAVMTVSAVTNGRLKIGGTISGGTLSGTSTIVSYGTFTEAAGSGTINLSKTDTWTNSTAVTEANSSSSNFAELMCDTNFGDPNGSPVSGKTWTNGTGYNTSRNYASGLISAHIYEVAGTYPITTVCRDATGQAGATATGTITVTNPDTVFSTNTACVDNVAGHTAGCTGTEITKTGPTSFSDAITQARGANGCGTGIKCQRIRFNRGDTFITATTTTIATDATGLIDSYGAGAQPLIQETQSGFNYILVFTAADWRVMDLEFDGTNLTDADGIGGSVGNKSNILVLRNSFIHFSAAINESYFPFMFVVDNSMTLGNNSGSYCIYSAGSYNYKSFMGNYCNVGSSAGHGIRINPTGAVGGLIEHNNIYVAGASSLALRGNSSYYLISDNIFIGSSSTSNVWCGPENVTSFEYFHDSIFERNYFLNGSGSGGMNTFQCSYMTIRNNIYDASALTSTKASITIGTANHVGVNVPTGNNIYNNTFYNSKAGGAAGYSGILLSNVAGTITPSAGGGPENTFTIGSIGGSFAFGALGATLVTGTGGLTSNHVITACSIDCQTGTITFDGTAETLSGAAITVNYSANSTNMENNLVFAPTQTQNGNGSGTQATVTYGATGINTVGAEGTYGNSSLNQIKCASSSCGAGITSPFIPIAPVNLIDYRIPASSYAVNNSGDGAVTLFPTIFVDFFLCKDKTATNFRSGAMVPAVNAMCFGAAR